MNSLKLSQSQTLGLYLNDNVIVGGICQLPDEDCRNAAANFFINMMNLDPQQQDIISAHRLGEGIKKGDIEFPPLMKVRCSSYFHSVVWDNRTCLKGQKDPDYHWKYFVDIQKPESHRAANARYKDAIQKCHRKNRNKPENEKEIPKIKGNKFFINGELIPDPIFVPGPEKMLKVSPADKEELNDIDFDSAPAYNLMRSSFEATVYSFNDVERAYLRLKLDHLYATHIMMGCVFNDNGGVSSFSSDEGEEGGGVEVLKILAESSVENYAVFVLRWKLGGDMGPSRFKCIAAVTKKVIQKMKIKKELAPPVHQSDAINRSQVAPSPGEDTVEDTNTEQVPEDVDP